MRDVVIVDSARTPIGRAAKGSLVSVRPDDLAATVVHTLLDRLEFDPTRLEDHIVGIGYPEKTQGFCAARRINHLAGLPESIPGATISRFCGSSLSAFRVAFQGVRAGEGNAYLASGVESVSWVGRTLREEDKHPQLLRGGIADAYIPMLDTAEIVAAREGVTRDEMDRFALRSHQRALAARDNGATAREIIPVTLADGTVVLEDDGPRRTTSLDVLAALRPLIEGGVVTAGNSCPLNDGAAAMLLADRDWAEAEGLPVRARVLGTAAVGLDPRVMGLGPIEASRRVLDRVGLSVDDLDAVEINEAFAAQAIPSARALGVDEDRQLNQFGGAIALGHPFGMSGVRIIGTLLNVLEHRGGRYGLAALCIGGGQGMAAVIERI